MAVCCTTNAIYDALIEFLDSANLDYTVLRERGPVLVSLPGESRTWNVTCTALPDLEMVTGRLTIEGRIPPRRYDATRDVVSRVNTKLTAGRFQVVRTEEALIYVAWMHVEALRRTARDSIHKLFFSTTQVIEN